MDRRRSRARVVVAALVGAVLAIAGSALADPVDARPAQIPTAAPTAACPAGSHGVTVVVDFADLPGGVQIRCVDETVSSGLDALRKAGFVPTGTQRFPGLLCRIDGQPVDEPCVNAPPPDRYWAYWTAAEPGGDWTYSDVGAGNRTPPPGSVEGWAFSDGCTRAPQGPPCPGPATTTTRPRTTTTTRGAGGAAGGPSGTSPTSPPDAVADPLGGTATPQGAPGSTVTTEVPDGGTAPQPGEEGDARAHDEQAAAAVGGDDGGGSPGGVLIGLGVVAALGALAWGSARRRGTAREPA